MLPSAFARGVIPEELGGHSRGRWATMGREETNHMRLPLEDVTVIDLSHALAGPFCSTMLADFGARVIKLEPKGAGDIARAWGTPLPGGETTYFVSLHRNKQGIEVDLKHPRGKEASPRAPSRAQTSSSRTTGRARWSAWAWPMRRLAGATPASSTARCPASARTAPIAIAPRSTSSSRPRAA